jgi:hypothetical protein
MNRGSIRGLCPRVKIIAPPLTDNKPVGWESVAHSAFSILYFERFSNRSQAQFGNEKKIKKRELLLYIRAVPPTG